MRYALLLLILTGCSTTRIAEVDSRPHNDFSDYGSKWIPEAGTFIDYSEDFYSWHYHGREREATPEEISLYEISESIKDAEAIGDDNRVIALRDAKNQLLRKYSPQLFELARRDEKHWNMEIQDLIDREKIQHAGAK